MHDIQTTATDNPVAWTSVSLSVTRLRSANSAQLLDVLLAMETSGDQGNIVLEKNHLDLIQPSPNNFCRRVTRTV